MKTLYLLRGLPGSGKTTLARALDVFIHLEADQFFMDNGKYKFDVTKLGAAHKWCQETTEHFMNTTPGLADAIVVSNTFTTEKELKPYLELAEKYDYRIVSLIVENRHDGKSIHDVPDETLEKMEKRFTFKLR